MVARLLDRPLKFSLVSLWVPILQHPFDTIWTISFGLSHMSILYVSYCKDDIIWDISQVTITCSVKYFWKILTNGRTQKLKCIWNLDLWILEQHNSQIMTNWIVKSFHPLGLCNGYYLVNNCLPKYRGFRPETLTRPETTSMPYSFSETIKNYIHWYYSDAHRYQNLKACHEYIGKKPCQTCPSDE